MLASINPSLSTQSPSELPLPAPSQAPNPVAAAAHAVPAPVAPPATSGATPPTTSLIPAARAGIVSAPAAVESPLAFLASPASLETTHAETADPSTATSATANLPPAISAASLANDLFQLFAANRSDMPLSLLQQSQLYDLLPNAHSRQRASIKEKIFFAFLDVGSILKKSRASFVWRRSKRGVASIARRCATMEGLLERLCLDLSNDIVMHTPSVAPQITLVVQPVDAVQASSVISDNSHPLPTVPQQAELTHEASHVGEEVPWDDGPDGGDYGDSSTRPSMGEGGDETVGSNDSFAQDVLTSRDSE